MQMLLVHAAVTLLAVWLTFERDLGWVWAGMTLAASAVAAAALFAWLYLLGGCAGSCAGLREILGWGLPAVGFGWYAGVATLLAGFAKPFKFATFLLGFPAGVLGFGTLWP